MTRWTRATAAEMADALGSGETTSVELTRAALRRIEKVMTETGPLVAWLRRNVPGGRGDGAGED